MLYIIKQVELAVRAHMEAALKKEDITTHQYTALTVLLHRDGLSAAALARNSFVTAQTMGEMLATLERRGLVTREVDPDNRRRTLTCLTAQGHELLDRYRLVMEDLEDDMAESLTFRQREALRGYLNICRTNLEGSPRRRRERKA
ncbi:MarR family winged helix-turn-helix transcriptional regulator [Rhodococcus sp. NPDC059968]|uniref:MarR family winged helix-turn-helix transcriptional regulator n=1 Tax=Rhodococcus sp. NPDC059968 TaxID=3347017 RepID=UPI00366C71ED